MARDSVNSNPILSLPKEASDCVFFGVVGLTGITTCWSDSKVFFVNEVLVVKVFRHAKFPPLSNPFVRKFGHRQQIDHQVPSP